MHSIEQQAIETFQTNLLYLQESQPEVFQKIDILNLAIENGSYKEKYSLEYRNGYFDILELSSNHYLYNQDSNEHANKLAKSINYKKSDNVIEGFYNTNFTDEQVEKYDGIINVNNIFFATAKIMQYAAQNTSKNDEMKDIYKFIFCGIGLGLHLLKIQNKINASMLLIYEDNLELFRLSLFTLNYQKLSQKAKLFFSILDNEEQFQKVFYNFFTHGYTYNHYMKYAILSQDDIGKIKRFQSALLSSNYLIYPYSTQLKELLKAPEYLVEKYPFLDLSKEYFDISPLSKKPVILIASGPSLGKNILWLQKNQDKFFIVCVMSSIKTLYKYSIKPDLVLHMDSQELSIGLLDKIDIENFFDQTLFIFSSVVARNVLKRVPKDKIYCFESASRYKQGFRTFASPSIGEVSYAITLILGTEELYLLGLDMALDPETMASHTQEHVFSGEAKGNSAEHEQYTSMRETIFYTKGNFLETVPITSLFKISLAVFNRYSKELLHHNQKVFNLNNGAYLEGAQALHVEDIDTKKFITLEKREKFNQLRSFFDAISQNSMNKADIDNLDEQIAEAKRLLSLVNAFKQSATTSNYDIYIKQFYALYAQLLNFENQGKYDINLLFSSYTQLIFGYIFDIFNTKQLKNQKRHVKKINEIYIKQLLKILNLYLTTMKVYREWAEK